MRVAEQRREHDRDLLARRLPAHIEALVAGRRHLGEIDRHAAELDAGGEALQQSPEHDEQRREHADRGVAGHEGDEDGAAGHDRQRDDEALAPPDPVDIGAEHERADRAHGEAGGEAQEGRHQRGVRVVARKERVRDLPGVDAEQKEVVHLEEVAAGDAQDGLQLVESRSAHIGLPTRRLPAIAMLRPARRSAKSLCATASRACVRGSERHDFQSSRTPGRVFATARVQRIASRPGGLGKSATIVLFMKDTVRSCLRPK